MPKQIKKTTTKKGGSKTNKVTKVSKTSKKGGSKLNKQKGG
tara:strand:- start:352 stop:474 length:123 start_codon:yes stop_codon:yes gene_type:complete